MISYSDVDTYFLTKFNTGTMKRLKNVPLKNVISLLLISIFAILLIQQHYAADKISMVKPKEVVIEGVVLSNKLHDEVVLSDSNFTIYTLSYLQVNKPLSIQSSDDLMISLNGKSWERKLLLECDEGCGLVDIWVKPIVAEETKQKSDLRITHLIGESLAYELKIVVK